MTPTDVSALLARLDSALSQALACAKGQTLVVALSGGLDSMLLLSRLRQVAPSLGCALKAVHVHHGLQAAADDFAAFCQQCCQQWQLDYVLRHVQIDAADANTEAKARAARYQALYEEVPAGGVLLTAHHADDQLETLLLALKRGAGLAGLAGIAAMRIEQHVTVVRPWLEFSRAELTDVAIATQLQWMDDPTNSDTAYDRNFLREQVVPLLAARFPAIAKTAARSVQHIQQAYRTETALRERQLHAIITEDTGAKWPWLSALLLPRLDCSALQQTSMDEVLPLLKHYLHPLSLQISMVQLTAIYQQVVLARHDATPQFVLGDICIRRFDNRLWVEPLQPQPDVQSCWYSTDQLRQGVEFAGFFLLLADVRPTGEYDSLPCDIQSGAWLSTGALNRRLTLGNAHFSRALKDWCKLRKIPPWRRGVLPVLIAKREKEAVEVDLMLGVGSRFDDSVPRRLYYRAVERHAG